ncbi:hypothetical protein DCF83_18055 (plasmid) [Edwardsiella tarda]|nr:hypothetical protein DCF83_18055 [Edwardsiella tarda]
MALNKYNIGFNIIKIEVSIALSNSEFESLKIDSRNAGVPVALKENQKPTYKIIELIRMYLPKFHVKPTINTIAIAAKSGKGIVIIFISSLTI